MSKLEKTVSVANTILAILTEVGAIHIKAFFPHPYYHTFCNHKSKKTFHSSLSNLKRRKLIRHLKGNEKIYLTKKGREEALFAELKIKKLIFKKEEKSIKDKKMKWDGYWRIVIFDIPNKLFRLRNDFRDLLKNIGFYKLQNSVWVYPHKVPEFLDETLNDNRIKRYVRFLLVKEVYYDWDLKKIFFKNKIIQA